MATIIGWDIGGVHVKAAIIVDGRVEAVEQMPCTLWLGVEHLRETLRMATERYGRVGGHAVTMTGELAESFENRAEGVRAICEEAWATFGKAGVRVYAPDEAGRARFLAGGEAVEAWPRVASANWHATAAWAATVRPDALLIDIGSTTTDIIPIAGGKVAVRGFSDAERLTSGELLYTGVVRTSLMALAGEAPFAGGKQRLMAENFSTTADLYRLSGELAAEDDSYPASDGRGKGAEECRARLARMLGRDATESSDAGWNRLAQWFRERHLARIADAVAQVLSAGEMPSGAPFLAAGAGHFLVPELARRFGYGCERIADLFPAAEGARHSAGVCAPAVAVGLLGASK